MVTSTKKLGGLCAMRPNAYRLTHKHTRRVCRAYGGVFTHDEVKNRYLAFMKLCICNQYGLTNFFMIKLYRYEISIF